MPLPNTFKKPTLLRKLQWVVDPIEYMESSAQQYPDIFAAREIGFGDNVVFVNHPQAIQEVLTNDRKKFIAPAYANKILRPLLGNYSTAMLDGERHKRRRQLLLPPFHGERMRAYGQLICDIAEKVFSKLPTNKPFLARSAMQEISMQVMLQAVFGLYEGERYQQVKQRMEWMTEVLSSPLNSSFLVFSFLQKDFGAWSPWGKFVRRRQQIYDLVDAEIAERRAKPDPERIDILSLLIEARDEDGNPMTDEELLDELYALLFAGHETTATAMAWGLYWSHSLPEVQGKLLQELDFLGDSPDPMSISRLPYLSAFCNETLRIHPVAPVAFAREVQEPVEILGHRLEPGTLVCCCIYLVQHREDLYPQPKKFRPERFLERQFSPYEFMPFGGGARRCVGDALAVFEMKLVLATILSRYQMTLTDTKPEIPRRRGVTLAPAGGVKMVITGQRVRQESSLTVVS